MEKNIFEGFEMDGAMKLTVPALRGIMGGIDYYVITMPFSIATRYLTTTDRDENLSAKERENRKVTPQRFKQIAKYIRDNRDDYRFSALTCTFGKDKTEKPIDFESPQPTGDLSFIGMLTLDSRDPFLIVDGQHRFGAIKKVMNDNPDLDLGDERITVVLFPYTSIKHAQQLFSDLNRNAKKTTASLDILFDHRDIVNRVVQKLVDQTPVFKGRINLEDASVPRQSKEMFTIATIYQASKPIIKVAKQAGLLTEELGEKDSITDEPKDNEDLYVSFLAEVWDFIAEQFPEWGKVTADIENIVDIRSDYLHWNSGVISSIGEFVAESMRQLGDSWQTAVKNALTHPMTHGWRRDADDWQGIITAATQVMPRSLVRPSLKSYLKKLGGLDLSEADERQLDAIRKMKEELGVPTAI
jgi:DNA sulfur modification protein DndB